MSSSASTIREDRPAPDEEDATLRDIFGQLASISRALPESPQKRSLLTQLSALDVQITMANERERSLICLLLTWLFEPRYKFTKQNALRLAPLLSASGDVLPKGTQVTPAPLFDLANLIRRHDFQEVKLAAEYRLLLVSVWAFLFSTIGEEQWQDMRASGDLANLLRDEIKRFADHNKSLIEIIQGNNMVEVAEYTSQMVPNIIQVFQSSERYRGGSRIKTGMMLLNSSIRRVAATIPDNMPVWAVAGLQKSAYDLVTILRASTEDLAMVETVHALLVERCDSSLLDFKEHHEKPNNVVEFAYFVKLVLEEVRDKQLQKLDRKVDGLGLSRVRKGSF